MIKFSARVIKGRGRGKRIGIPTVNLQPPENFSLKEGIWACWVYPARSGLGKQKLAGALHWGPVPVFGEEKPSLEVHILGNALEIPVVLEVEAVAYLRPVMNFKDAEELKKQVRKDIIACKKALGVLN